MNATTIAYLAPQLTALESSFVYEELLAVEERDISVVPVSVHVADGQEVDNEALLRRTVFLYEDGRFLALLRSISALFHAKISHKQSFRWLTEDILELGLFNRNSWKLRFQYVIAARLAKVLIKNECRHLHIHFAHVSAQIGMYAASMAGVPFTVMSHANDIFQRAELLNAKAARCKKFITISEYNRRYLESVGLPESKLAVVRCGVNLEAPTALPSPKNGELYRVGTLSRLVEKKGTDILIKAFSGIEGAELSIAGSGPDEQYLQELVAELDLADAVRFEGNLARSEVAGWLGSLDVFVLACRRDKNGDMDGIPVVLMEAMSQGVPVISTDLSGIPELIIHGETGLLARPDDVDSLRTEILAMKDSVDLRARLSRAAAAHVVAEFGQSVNIDRLLSCFNLSSESVSL